MKGQLGPTLNAPAKIYMTQGMIITDSATLKNGAFELKGTAQVPSIADLMLRRHGHLNQEYRNRNFDILGVSADDEKSRAKWVKAIADDHLPWTQVSDLKGWQNAAALRYAVRSYPSNFLVGPDGKIVAVNLHGEELETVLAKLIK